MFSCCDHYQFKFYYALKVLVKRSLNIYACLNQNLNRPRLIYLTANEYQSLKKVRV